MAGVRDRILVLFAVVMLLLLPVLPAGAVPAPEVQAAAAVLMEADTGQILYAKNPDAGMYPASTTKVLTALVVLERCRLDERVSVPPGFPGIDGQAIYVRPGETFTVRELLYALLVHSANDAALLLAEHTAGSVPAFARLMNEKAQELGARHSHFVSPHGLPDANHYTTARDLALIARAAMQNPIFRQIVATRNHVLPPRPDPEALRHLWNTNKLLWQYEGANGVKTGYTTQARQCLVASARRGDRELLAVLLRSEGNNIWTDAKTLLDYGFEGFTRSEIVSRGRHVARVEVAYGRRDVELVTAASFSRCFPAGTSPGISWDVRIPRVPEAPVRRGQQVGELVFYGDGKRLGSVPLLAAADVPRAVWASWWFWTGVAGGGFLLVRYHNRKRREKFLFRRR
ncbi:MAG: D-alanyl-D-alanine carboxypeptidase family protein [Bacillota bacterium]